jgi:DNA repair protein RadD
VCPDCGYEFPPPEREKHEATAHAGGILSGEVTETEYEVTEAFYSVHHKRGAPPDHPRTMRVDYRCGLNDYHSEWVCPEHEGYARQKFETWWRARSNEPFPESAEQAVDLAEAGALAPTHAITVRSVAGETFDTIPQHQLGPIPPRLDGRDEREDADLPDYQFEDDGLVPF